MLSLDATMEEDLENDLINLILGHDGSKDTGKRPDIEL